MVRLIAKTPCEELLPVEVRGARLAERDLGPVTAIMPLGRQDRAVAAALKALGLGWPAPNRAVTSAAAAVLWSGMGQAFLAGAAPEGLDGVAALSDQSDAWAAMELSGPSTEAVLARLVAIDVRAAVFAPGHVARTGLNHMMSLLWRTGAEAVTILVFRSMAATAVHELHTAMKAVEARSHL